MLLVAFFEAKRLSPQSTPVSQLTSSRYILCLVRCFSLSMTGPRLQDYRRLLYSEDIFRQNTLAFWQAVDRTLPRQLLFLFWYYLLTTLVALGFGHLAGSYGSMRANRFYRWFADKFLFPRISE